MPFFLLAPLSLVLGYYAVLSPVLYETQTFLVVEKPITGGGDASSLMGTSGRNEGNYLFRAFVTSYEEFMSVDARVNLARQYSFFPDIIQSFGGVLSFFSRSRRALYDYYTLYIVDTDISRKEGLVKFSVKASDRHISYEITRKILDDARLKLALLNQEPDRLLLQEHQATMQRLTKAITDDEKTIAANMLSSGIYDGSGFYASSQKAWFQIAADQIVLEGKYSVLKDTVERDARAMDRELRVYEAGKTRFSNDTVEKRNVVLENDRLIHEVRTLSGLLDTEMASYESVGARAIMSHYFLKTVSGPVVEETPFRPGFWWSVLTVLAVGLLLFMAAV